MEAGAVEGSQALRGKRCPSPHLTGEVEGLPARLDLGIEEQRSSKRQRTGDFELEKLGSQRAEGEHAELQAAQHQPSQAGEHQAARHASGQDCQGVEEPRDHPLPEGCVMGVPQYTVRASPAVPVAADPAMIHHLALSMIMANDYQALKQLILLGWEPGPVSGLNIQFLPRGSGNRWILLDGPTVLHQAIYSCSFDCAALLLICFPGLLRRPCIWEEREEASRQSQPTVERLCFPQQMAEFFASVLNDEVMKGAFLQAAQVMSSVLVGPTKIPFSALPTAKDRARALGQEFGAAAHLLQAAVHVAAMEEQHNAQAEGVAMQL
eukprot:CAMPEP_0184293868 /NCGR_PEP_ID=MMETSP1049-20130417/5190_1 /TAXON_ID=77928 /ORGANISM="Proteomonas sulcata, Strain CCMP704" /LENGTH=321 /DNA_ID=CAMNT_0026601963 /DNA_START=189 /DNA_END=1154 /DNA_ORIENTATION=-